MPSEVARKMTSFIDEDEEMKHLCLNHLVVCFHFSSQHCKYSLTQEICTWTCLCMSLNSFLFMLQMKMIYLSSQPVNLKSLEFTSTECKHSIKVDTE